MYANGSFHFEVDGGNINDYATVPQADIASGGSARMIRVPAGNSFAAFTVRSRRGTPDVELISPSFRGRRLHPTLKRLGRRGNHSGAMASISRRAHTESFLVVFPKGGCGRSGA